MYREQDNRSCLLDIIVRTTKTTKRIRESFKASVSTSRATIKARSFTARSIAQFSPGSLLWSHRFASCNTISYHGTRKRRARPACVPLSGTSFSTCGVTRVRERNAAMSMQSSDVVECETSSRLLGTYPLPTSVWSTYLPGRIARFCRK